jgi:hypothetical protein
MKKLALSLVAVGALAGALVFSGSTPASACDGEKNAAHAGSAAAAPVAADTAAGKVQTVSLEGKVVTTGCPIEAAKQDCTGTSLVVGEAKHPIRRAKKGVELAGKAKDTDKLVKVSGTQEGDYLTVTNFQIKG